VPDLAENRSSPTTLLSKNKRAYSGTFQPNSITQDDLGGITDGSLPKVVLSRLEVRHPKDAMPSNAIHPPDVHSSGLYGVTDHSQRVPTRLLGHARRGQRRPMPRSVRARTEVINDINIDVHEVRTNNEEDVLLLDGRGWNWDGRWN
jgi:hypothetical protein